MPNMTASDIATRKNSRSLLLVWSAVSLLLASQGVGAITQISLTSLVPPKRSPLEHNPLLDLRGGASPPSSSKKKPKKNSTKNSKGAKSSSSSGGTTKSKKIEKTDKGAPDSDNESDKTSEEKQVIKEAMEKDTADALGDAIRSKSDQPRSENPLLDQIDQSMYSVGWALGASDRRQLDDYVANLEEAADEDGGVAGPPSFVLANYFLKSHGGAHALQCLCSLLASSAAFASLLVPDKSPMKRVLLQRSLLFAMTKLVAGLLGTAWLAAKAIPMVGLRKARVWMEQLAVDPVSHCVFYAACILLWLPTNAKQAMTFLGDVSWISTLLVAPILLREVLSTILVASDVLVLWATSAKEDEADATQSLLQTSQQTVNSVMNLLVTPDRWRAADPAVRQRILAKLTSSLSLSLEVVVGMIIALDAVVQMGRIVFGDASEGKPGFALVVQRLICARLYLQYLWTRRRMVDKVVTNI